MQLTDMQLDALREMANVGSGNAATALAGMLGCPVDLSVPSAAVLALADAVEAVGSPDAEVTAVALPVFGEIEAIVLLTFKPEHARQLCGFLGIEYDADPEMALSALGEIGNILGSAYINALGAMCGMALEPSPPQTATDMLGAIVASVLASAAASNDMTLLLDSALMLEQGGECEFGFLFVPNENGVAEVLGRLGLWGHEAA